MTSAVVTNFYRKLYLRATIRLQDVSLRGAQRHRDSFTCYQSSHVQALQRSQLPEDRAEDHHEIINDEDTPLGAYDQFSYLGRGESVPKSH